MYTDERAISFGDSTLELGILNEPDVYPVGAVNTKNKETIGPGTYVEARTSCADLPGTTSNFWSKPNSEDWPPEIDFKETPIRDDSDVDRSTHHIHWTTDGEPNGPHSDYNAGSHNGGYDKSKNWTVYGCRWLQDSVTYYIDGEEFAHVTDPDIMESVNNGAPFYLMLDLMNWPGPSLIPNDFSGYKSVHEVDWVRIWDQDSSAGGETTDDGSTVEEDDPAEEGDHYIWFRSESGDPATFQFETSEGNIHFDSSGQTADYTISDDGFTAEGTVERTSSLPGFWYDGEIADFSYSGPLDVFIDNEEVDPESLVPENDTSASEDGDHYAWFRSNDGTAANFIFETSGGNVHYDSSDQTADYWIGDDGILGGGTVERTSSLPGFWYDGEITDLSYSGPLDLFIDNEAVDPDSLVDPDEPGPFRPTGLPQRITIDGTNSGTSSYSITVSDQIKSVSIPDGDTIDGTTAAGSVEGDADVYDFSGSITQLQLEGDAVPSLNDSVLKLVRIDRSSDSDGSVTYLIETTGTLIAADIGSTALDDNDMMNDSKALGSVDTDSDAYWLLDGDVTDVSTFNGSIVTTVDGTVLD